MQERDSDSWLLFLYKVPHEPSTHRIYVWRKLKKFGAIRLYDAAWILPMTAHSLKQFQWLKARVKNLGGDSLVWEAHLAVSGQEEMLRRVLSEWSDRALANVK
jgi:hypothetical protein